VCLALLVYFAVRLWRNTRRAIAESGQPVQYYRRYR
jgi:hypothetical protein